MTRVEHFCVGLIIILNFCLFLSLSHLWLRLPACLTSHNRSDSMYDEKCFVPSTKESYFSKSYLLNKFICLKNEKCVCTGEREEAGKCRGAGNWEQSMLINTAVELWQISLFCWSELRHEKVGDLNYKSDEEVGRRRGNFWNVVKAHSG